MFTVSKISGNDQITEIEIEEDRRFDPCSIFELKTTFRLGFENQNGNPERSGLRVERKETDLEEKKENEIKEKR